MISFVTVAAEVMDLRKNMKELQKMAFHECEVKALRNGVLEELKSGELVPGDVIEVPMGKMPCDAILLNGSAIVNESMLTGESVPVIKGAITEGEEKYNPDKDAKYTVYSGTDII